jgi:hypothetical protein
VVSAGALTRLRGAFRRDRRLGVGRCNTRDGAMELSPYSSLEPIHWQIRPRKHEAIYLNMVGPSPPARSALRTNFRSRSTHPNACQILLLRYRIAMPWPDFRI